MFSVWLSETTFMLNIWSGKQAYTHTPIPIRSLTGAQAVAFSHTTGAQFEPINYITMLSAVTDSPKDSLLAHCNVMSGNQNWWMDGTDAGVDYRELIWEHLRVLESVYSAKWLNRWKGGALAHFVAKSEVEETYIDNCRVNNSASKADKSAQCGWSKEVITLSIGSDPHWWLNLRKINTTHSFFPSNFSVSSGMRLICTLSYVDETENGYTLIFDHACRAQKAADGW